MSAPSPAANERARECVEHHRTCKADAGGLTGEASNGLVPPADQLSSIPPASAGQQSAATRDRQEGSRPAGIVGTSEDLLLLRDPRWSRGRGREPTHRLESGYDIRNVLELLGHHDFSTAMVFAHVLNRGVRRPADEA